MSANSAISWTDHTFNIVWGCTEVSPACDECYAREWAARLGFKVWGPDAPRRTFGEKYWNEPLIWNRRAYATFGRNARVFCSSMADIFDSHPTTQQEFKKLPPLVQATPYLDWLLLTKHGWNDIHRHPELTSLPNAHMGVTVESQEYTYRITDKVKWLSLEPLLGPINLEAVLKNVQWVIVGGESEDDKNPEKRGTARPMKLEWVHNLREQCDRNNVAFHFKQTGHRLAEELGLRNKAGKDPAEWPEEMRVQQFPVWEIAA